MNWLLKITVLFFLALSCKSTPDIPMSDKLDLRAEKQLILDSTDIPDAKKKFIVDTFDRTETFCNSMVETMESLYKTIDKQKAQIVKLDKQAAKYRFWRNILIILCIAFILYELRGLIFPIAKKLLGMPI